MTSPTDVEFARELDRQDELAGFREAFVIDNPELIYLDGNSLGRLPKRTVERLRVVVEQEWGGRLVRGWNDGWFESPQRVGAKIAKLIGAEPDEVIVCDSTSVNLFKLVLATLQTHPDRRQVVSDELNFPSDLYVLQSVLRLVGPEYRLDLVRSADGMSISTDAVRSTVTSGTALVALSHVTFKSGFLYNMAAVTDLVHNAGSLVLWDLCHSIGVVPIDLKAAWVDLAVGCTYKYLNGGPGSPAFIYVRRNLQDQLTNPIWGWFGRRSQFEFGLDYEAAPGVRRFQTGTPPILSLAAVEPGLDLLLEAGVNRVRAKSLRQTEYLIDLWEQLLAPLGVTLNSPRNPAQRGSHVSLGHTEGLRVARLLIEEMQVIPDFRYPDNIRFGISPLYTSFVEIREALVRFQRVLAERIYEKYPLDHPAVT